MTTSTRTQGLSLLVNCELNSRFLSQQSRFHANLGHRMLMLGSLFQQNSPVYLINTDCPYRSEYLAPLGDFISKLFVLTNHT
ncbi:hypothetical protein [Pseudoalteromonas obscura]|uniref:hypothetical protein n=1 Tax=Pseudoalteromonas obscura TaxID=3048491 RepID=UPI0024DE37A4|nr:hypothetical protein [Pseudoalteromonas sp. P94(2023)]